MARGAYEAAAAALGEALGRRVLFLFERAGMSWALPVDVVTEVVPAAALAPHPGAPPWLRGLVQVGPTGYPVLDLATRLAGRVSPLDLSDRFILCGEGLAPVALHAARVFDVRRLDDVRAVRAEEDAPGVELLGVATTAREPVWLLSASALADAARTRSRGGTEDPPTPPRSRSGASPGGHEEPP